jgi:dethiobiotin synthetase
MAGGLFITGTDTGVGKTIVTAGITYCLRGAGMDAVPMKPVQTGAVDSNGQFVSPDLRFCLDICSLSPSAEQERLMSPYCYQTACSPHLAAKTAGAEMDLSHIIECYNTLSGLHDAVVVEGAGGVLAPVDESRTMLDVMTRLSLPVVVVARSGLGTINHTLLTLRALKNAGLEVIGVVFSDGPESPPELIADDNIRTITRIADTVSLGRVEPLSGDLQEAIRTQFTQASIGVDVLINRLRST